MTADLVPSGRTAPESPPAPTGAEPHGAGTATAHRAERRGWLAVAALTAAVAASWAPLLTARFGDNHLGRVIGRYALHMRNLHQDGLAGSRFSADWSPYASGPYAHHPPLLNLLDALFTALPGDGEYQLRIAPYLLALLAVPAAAWLLRGCGIRWVPTLLAVAAMVVTGFYWIYSPIMFDLGPILALAAVVVRLRRRPAPAGRLGWWGGAAALVAALGSWPGIAFAGALGLWLLAARRRPDRLTVPVGAGALAGLAVSLAFMVGVHGTAVLADQTELRTAGGGFTAAEFVARQGRYLVDLLPVWYLVLFPVALLAGLVDRRTRFLTAISAVFAAGWVVVLNNGAFVHDYWGYLLLVPGLVGMGALFDRLARADRPGWRSRARAAAALVLALVLAAGFAGMVFGPTGQDYLHRPADAGELAVAHPPPPGQRYAWHAGLGAPRWLAYYWDLRPRDASPELLAAEAGPDELVMLNLSRLPAWLPEAVGSAAVARQGRYAVVRVADLRGYPGGGP